MKLISGDCIFCDGREIINHLDLPNNIAGVIKHILLDELNVDEFVKVEADINGCPSCLHKLLVLQTHHDNIKAVTTNARTSGSCVLCTGTDMLISNILEKPNYYSSVIRNALGENLGNDIHMLCINCTNYLDGLYTIKTKLFTQYPKLQGDSSIACETSTPGRKLLRPSRKSNCSSSTQRTSLRRQAGKKKPHSNVSLVEGIPSSVILDTVLKDFIPLKMGSYKLDSIIKGDSKFWNEIPYVSLEVLPENNPKANVKRNHGILESPKKLILRNKKRRIQNRVAQTSRADYKPNFKIKLKPKSKQKKANRKRKRGIKDKPQRRVFEKNKVKQKIVSLPEEVLFESDRKLVVKLIQMDFSNIINNKNVEEKEVEDAIECLERTLNTPTGKTRKSVSFADEKNVEIEYKEIELKVGEELPTRAKITLKPLLKGNSKYGDNDTVICSVNKNSEYKDENSLEEDVVTEDNFMETEENKEENKQNNSEIPKIIDVCDIQDNVQDIQEHKQILTAGDQDLLTNQKTDIEKYHDAINGNVDDHKTESVEPVGNSSISSKINEATFNTEEIEYLVQKYTQVDPPSDLVNDTESAQPVTNLNKEESCELHASNILNTPHLEVKCSNFNEVNEQHNENIQIATDDAHQNPEYIDNKAVCI